jgi:hypothetical protein
VETLIRAFALVHEEMPAARLRLFGSPPKGREPYLERCQALTADLGIAGSVTFEGRVENIRDAYDAGQIVALSSVSEGFPYSLIEAMTCGRTCVATDVGGVTEAVGDTGLVVPPRSPKQMARACLTLLQNDDLRHRLGAAARTRALENFTVDGAISAFDEIYSFVGAARPGPAAPIKLTTEDLSDDLLPWEAAEGSRGPLRRAGVPECRPSRTGPGGSRSFPPRMPNRATWWGCVNSSSACASPRWIPWRYPARLSSTA